MKRTGREWWKELTGEGRVWSMRHPSERVRHARYVLHMRTVSEDAEALARKVMAEWDQPAFIERMRRYWDPFPTLKAPKYLDVQQHMLESAERFFSLGLFEDGTRKRILDIGCGPGYFLSIARSLGHEILGIDLDEEPIYNEIIDVLGIPRIAHRVTSTVPLPPLQGQFDIVGAFAVTFHLGQGADGGSWSADEWMRALDAFIGVTAPGGTVVIRFNVDPRTGLLYPPQLRRSLGERTDVRPRFFGEHLFVRKLELPAASSYRDAS